jgi:pimeloyl-ACP methyl ester carboxylesterase
MPLSNPVIGIPGFTATELKHEYPQDIERVFGVLSKDYQRIALHPDDQRYEAQEPARITPDRAFNLVYGELIEELRHNLSSQADQPTPVFSFPYDWRFPLELTADRLSAFIDEVCARTSLLPHYFKAGYAQNPKVNLVGHSMGGLVIAEHLARSGGNPKLGKVATLGTPFRGSHEAVLKVATGNADLGANSSGSREREVSRITPALYYLVPSYAGAIVADAGFSVDLFQPGNWQPSVVRSIQEYIRLYGLDLGPAQARAQQLFAAMLAAASAHRQRLENLKLNNVGLTPDDWLAVVVVGEETRVRLHIESDQGQPWFDLAGEDRLNDWSPDAGAGKTQTGDGTVPYPGAKPPFLTEDKLICVCSGDFGYWELKDRLLEGMGVGLHATLPLMNLVQRLVTSHFLGAPFGEVWGRPAPDLGAMNWNPPIQGLAKKGS